MWLINFIYNVFFQKLDFFTKIKYIVYELVERPRFDLIRRADCPAIFSSISTSEKLPLHPVLSLAMSRNGFDNL